MGKDYKKEAKEILIRGFATENDVKWLASLMALADTVRAKGDGTARVVVYTWKPSGENSATGRKVLDITLDKDEILRIAVGENLNEGVN